MQHLAPVYGVAFSPDGKLILSGSIDRTAQLWDAATGKPLGPPLRYPTEVKAVAFHPDGKSVLTLGEDANARSWIVPPPMPGDVNDVEDWATRLTGMELDEFGAVRMLDAAAMKKRREGKR